MEARRVGVGERKARLTKKQDPRGPILHRPKLSLQILRECERTWDPERLGGAAWERNDVFHDPVYARLAQKYLCFES